LTGSSNFFWEFYRMLPRKLMSSVPLRTPMLSLLGHRHVVASWEGDQEEKKKMQGERKRKRGGEGRRNPGANLFPLLS
jgi:hypothetical protein